VLEKNIFLSVLGISMLVLVVALLIPYGKQSDTNPLLPWDIHIDENGNAKVFDLTLGKSTMAHASKMFHSEGKINIFVSPEKAISIEAFFNNVVISGLHANIILSLSLDQEILSGMYSRGARMTQLDDGAKKVTIASADMDTAANSVIQQITYLPKTNLEGDLIGKLFGQPDSIIKEDSGVEHWLYPKIGVDIVLNPNGKEVFQYVNPDRFDEVIKPLQEMVKAGK
jgi:hypothetical protein